MKRLFERITYKQAFDRLTDAYISGQVNPYNHCQCFVGNILAADFPKLQTAGRDNSSATCADLLCYSFCTEDITWIHTLEYTFMNVITKFLKSKIPLGNGRCDWISHYNTVTADDPAYENVLFSAFIECLDLLKDYYEENGQITDNVPFVIRDKKSKAHAS